MTRVTVLILAFTLYLSMADNAALPAGAPPENEETLPLVSLPVPINPAHMGYLGLSGGDTFKIPQIRARVVIVEIFSMYCPFCQREAPKINRLYNKIESNPELKDRIKIIGIGAGNSSFEVEVFRKKYDIRFPLFPDEDFSIHKCFGEVRTPFFIGVKINEDGAHKVFYSKLGGIESAEGFLKSMIKLSGLEKKGVQ
jgi:peroxiredoxin